ncbi:MAG: hypothetical protein NC336_10390, partial [Clostridium sp.]|nr:hypothetical protein [Clostridium sp.]
GCNAAGLCGADGDAIRATRRSPEPVDFGFVGDISAEGVNTPMISAMLRAGMTPVFCAINHDGAGTLLNCNADSVAAAMALAMSAVGDVDLVYCFEQPGVMEDIADPASVIPVITPESYAALRADGTISGGMVPKVENALKAVAAGVNTVTIRSASSLDNCSGTIIHDGYGSGC